MARMSLALQSILWVSVVQVLTSAERTGKGPSLDVEGPHAGGSKIQASTGTDILEHVDPPMPVRMSASEEALFKRMLSESSNYIEFGAGGSTVLAVSLPNLKRITVIESDPKWVRGLSQRADISGALTAGRLHFHLVDIGAVGAWGYPLQKQHANFQDYSSIGASAADTEGADFVLVDGRFRVASFLKVLKSCKPNTKIALHDYSVRPEYHIVERFADTLHQSESFSVFRKKSDIDDASLTHVIQEYEKNPALLQEG